MNEVLIGGLAGQGPQGHVTLAGRLANRHGLVAGATGTGKTVTLQVLAEGFSRMGVPVFTADVKGDLSGIAVAGTPHPRVDERLASLGINDWQPQASPVRLWDLYGESGHAVRASVASMGPDLMSSLLELNETQGGLMHLAFDHAEREGLELIDLKDLISLLKHIERERDSFEERYGRVSPQSLGAMLRRVHVLATQGGERFFAEPALDINDMLATVGKGEHTRGFINLLDGRELMQSPRLYTTFLLWFLSTLFRVLPERGDAEKPVLVFFFDEAHLLFDAAPKALLERLEQTVRLIRSKGVGVYFVTQSPADIPDDVLGQLGNRIQHALRAFTPRDQKAVKTAADTFRPNPALDTAQVITELGVGEALVSVLDNKGVPTQVERTLIAPPRGRIGPLTDTERTEVLASSSLTGRYDERIDRDSAHERLEARLTSQAAAIKTTTSPMPEAAGSSTSDAAHTDASTAVPGPVTSHAPPSYPDSSRSKSSSSGGRKRQGALETLIKSVMRALGSQLGRSLIRSLIRSFTKR
ncbi:helicase HerA-like domain-containing protein [Cobetia crustatorum]|uniref:helicase HerA-like domain-containing protein n=1 Tax=Cobetia crustatorum TaxID=553385 RepID=UPI000468FE4F|nr:helicase HerA-like domain-containing protein [Cobetia crustatorum]